MVKTCHLPHRRRHRPLPHVYFLHLQRRYQRFCVQYESHFLMRGGSCLGLAGNFIGASFVPRSAPGPVLGC